MAPNHTISSLIDADPFEHSFENDPRNQFITTLYNPEMINEFLDLYCRRRLIGEKCEELQEFMQQISEFEQKYEISFSLLAEVKQIVLCRSDPYSIKNGVPGMKPFVFMDLADMIRQAELIREVQSWGNQNYNNIIVDVPVVTHVQTLAPLNRQQPENEIENYGGRCRAPKSMKLGKTFFPLTVQAGLSVLTSVFDVGGLSAATEAKQLVHIAAASNMVGYIGCLADILLRHHDKCKAAKIMGSIGATAAVFGFLTMMGTLIQVNPVVMIGIATLVTLVFFVVVIKL